MITFFYLLLAYGICFGLQNKATFLYAQHPLLDALLKCVYCTGFHCGWMSWLVAWGVDGRTPGSGLIGIPASLVAWTISSSAFCYIVDSAVRWFEGNTPQE